MHRAQEPRQIARDAVEVDGVPELVQHGLGPALTRGVVAEHAHVAGTVDVDAERVLNLARAGREVAAPDHAAHVEAHGVERARSEGFEVGIAEERIEVDADAGRRILEERVVVVPGAQLVHPDAEANRELFVEPGLERTERCGSDLVDLRECDEQARLVELGRRERKREMVAIPE